MTLPTFLGIGAPRSGSTWLYNLLATHPDIYLHPKRKDIRFFNRYYGRGISWYKEFFKNEANTCTYKAIGEFSPDYLYGKNCAKRIAKIPSITKLILIIRNPSDRLFSKYRDFIISRNYKGSFDDFIQQYPEQVTQGQYSKFIKEYLKYFSTDQLLIMIFEESVADIEQTKKIIGKFLGVCPNKFPEAAGVKKINTSNIPKAGLLYSLAYSVTSFLRNTCNLDRFVDWYLDICKRIDARRVFGKSSRKPLFTKSAKRYLLATYSEEIDNLENLLGQDFSAWR